MKQKKCTISMTFKTTSRQNDDDDDDDNYYYDGFVLIWNATSLGGNYSPSSYEYEYVSEIKRKTKTEKSTIKETRY